MARYTAEMARKRAAAECALLIVSIYLIAVFVTLITSADSGHSSRAASQSVGSQLEQR